MEAYLEGQKAQDIEDKKTYVDYLPPNGIYKTKKEIVRAYEDSVKDPWNGFFELRLPISFGVMSSSPFPKQAEDDNSKPGSLLVVHSRYTTVRIYAREREKRLDDLDIDEARKNLTKNKDTNILMIRHIIINGVKGIEYLMDFKGRLLHRITFWKKGVGHTIIITSHPNNYKKDIYAIVELISNYKGKNAE